MTTSHYLNQCCIIVNWTTRNRLHWNLIEIEIFSLKKMNLKMSSAQMAAILSRPQCVNYLSKINHWSLVTGGSTSHQCFHLTKGQQCRTVRFPLSSAWTSCSINSRNAGDLRRHDAHVHSNTANIDSTLTLTLSLTLLHRRHPQHWSPNKRDGASNHRHLDCLFNHLFKLSSNCFHLMTSSWTQFSGFSQNRKLGR